MANRETAAAAATTNRTMRTISPPTQGIKRDHSDDEDEEETRRRVSQRTATVITANAAPAAAANDNTATNQSNNGNNESSIIVDYVKTISRTDNVQILKTSFRKLAKSFINNSLSNEHQRAMQHAFLRVGGPLAIVTVMNKHQDCEYLQSWAVVVLQKVTVFPDENRKEIAEVDGIQAILGAMKEYKFSYSIQLYGLGSLMNLCSLEANAELLVLQLNGINVIKREIPYLSVNEKEAEWRCKLLYNLSNVESLKQTMRDANAFSILGNALDNNKKNPEIQRWARNALKKLV